MILQHRLQRVVQKLYVLFQLYKVASGDGGIPLLVHAETIFGRIEMIVLAEVFGVCKVGGRGLINAGVVFRIPLRALFADRPAHTVLSKIGDDCLGDFHIGDPLVLGSPLTVHLHEFTEGFLAHCEVLRNLRKRIGAQDDRLLTGFSILSRRDQIDQLAVVPPVVPGPDFSFRHPVTSHLFSYPQYSGAQNCCKWRSLFFVLFSRKI